MNPCQIVLATTNAKKREELRRYLEGLPVELLPFPEGVEPPPEEGATFRENAIAKAVYVAKATRELVIAEDSGIEVDALGGRPGVMSARYSGEEATDEQNNAKLLAELKGVPSDKRTARYRCAIVLANEEGALLEAEGAVEGIIAEAPSGTYGFGYDPLFIYPPAGGTFGELGAAVKDKVSHRARALRGFTSKLRDFLQSAGREA